MSGILAVGSATVFPDLTGPSLYTGQKLTNALGFILRDHAFSIVEAQQAITASDCAMPIRQDVGLKLSTDLDSQNGNNCLTTPLVDSRTGLPFKIEKGALIDKIVIGKRKGACVDPNACILLGVIQDTSDDCCADHCAQRWIAESNPLTGDCLNQCGFFVIDATANCKACCLSSVGSCGTSSGCSGDDYQCCPTATPASNFSDCSPCGSASAIVQCLDPKSQLTAKFPGVTIGELSDLYIGLTIIGGVLRETDIGVTVSVIQQAADCGFCGQYGPFPGTGIGAGSSVSALFRH